MPEKREVGRVEWFDRGVGYGFIKRESGADLFVHHSEIIAPAEEGGQLKPGDTVEFNVDIDRAGRPCARGVQLLNTSSIVPRSEASNEIQS